ncbi:hypothetical protein KHA94_07560 [Bacillus sp. FJAT-49705]|uniref:Uncharacterized protein n=1 Tax=Cytobacillus citreus TaxID=2833586 RepID=A0ABS5NQF9_9BACI|nr:hypothetical protein [Cytobacillus citreus]MBS4190059.1 hypothetical protein [Cytobacillus citreus]
MKRIFMFAAIMGIVIGTYFLYQKQLGAIAFFLLSIYFFSLAYSQLSKKTHDGDEEKENGRKI